MFKNLLILFLAVVFGFIVYAGEAEAKVLPQSAKAGKNTISKSGGTTINVSPRLRADRRALLVNFANLQNANAVYYALIYKTSEQEEAATGALNLGGGSSNTSELLFGTCSKNVCRYHTGINNARLEVSYTSKTGKKYLKKFKIRV